MAAWDRQEKEPPKAYLHFSTYRDLGPTRTLVKVGKIFGVSLSLCEQESAAYNWVARCDQWDAHLRSTIDRAFVDEAARQAKRRAAAYSALLDKSLEALKKVDLKSARMGEIAQAMKAAAEGMRTEEGLAIAKTAVEVNDARTIIRELPSEMRRGLCSLLGENARPRELAAVAGGVPERLGASDEGEQ